MWWIFVRMIQFLTNLFWALGGGEGGGTIQQRSTLWHCPFSMPSRSSCPPDGPIGHGTAANCFASARSFALLELFPLFCSGWRFLMPPTHYLLMRPVFLSWLTNTPPDAFAGTPKMLSVSFTRQSLVLVETCSLTLRHENVKFIERLNGEISPAHWVVCLAACFFSFLSFLFSFFFFFFSWLVGLLATSQFWVEVSLRIISTRITLWPLWLIACSWCQLSLNSHKVRFLQLSPDEQK